MTAAVFTNVSLYFTEKCHGHNLSVLGAIHQCFTVQQLGHHIPPPKTPAKISDEVEEEETVVQNGKPESLSVAQVLYMATLGGAKG